LLLLFLTGLQLLFSKQLLLFAGCMIIYFTETIQSHILKICNWQFHHYIQLVSDMIMICTFSFLFLTPLLRTWKQLQFGVTKFDYKILCYSCISEQKQGGKKINVYYKTTIFSFVLTTSKEVWNLKTANTKWSLKRILK
jgi:hypothetical protein